MAGLSQTGRPSELGDLAHLRLGDACLQQRRTHAALAGGGHAGRKSPTSLALLPSTTVSQPSASAMARSLSCSSDLQK